MTVALFIPCYVDQFYPNAAIATLEILEKCSVTVVYPQGQTCCGQPLANSGFDHLTGSCNDRFVHYFSDFEYIVSPSGSCVLHIKERLNSSRRPDDALSLRHRVYELTEFLTDVLKVEKLVARFPFKVSLHQSCHGQRGLKLAQMSELVAPPFSKPQQLLDMVDGIQMINRRRSDECCGFGGTFCVTEEAVSVKMGKDCVADHLAGGAEYITAVDMSCLMHLEGILRRSGSKSKVLHIAEILNANFK